jgi:hypothetical protein
MEYPTEFKEKANTGRLMPSVIRKSDKAPDMWGVICIDREYAKHLLEQPGSEEFITVKLGAWKNASKNGNKYLSLNVNTFTAENAATPAPKKEEKDPWE